MFTLYAICAAVGGTVLLCQFALTVMGLMGGEGDFDGGDVHGDFHGGDFHGGDVHGGGFDGADAHGAADVHIDDGSGALAADHGSDAGSFAEADGGQIHHHGGDAHVHGARGETGSQLGFLRILTFRTITAGIAFFGLAGLASGASGLDAFTTLGIAGAAGVAALLGVHELMKALASLRSEGNVCVANARGEIGRVYLRIPENNAGTGKVTVNLQNRTVELRAVTQDEALPTGTAVVVVDVIDDDTVQVARLHEGGSIHNG
jgi:hypothetical protein